MADMNDDSDVQMVIDASGDQVLRGFAGLAQKHDVEIGLTLALPGTVISGILIGRNKWLDLLAESGASQGERAAAFKNSLRTALRLPEQEDDPEAAEQVRYGFLHLRDAAIQSGHLMTAKGMLWRVRIDEVSAWTLTVLRPDSA